MGRLHGVAVIWNWKVWELGANTVEKRYELRMESRPVDSRPGMLKQKMSIVLGGALAGGMHIAPRNQIIASSTCMHARRRNNMVSPVILWQTVKS